MCIIILDEIYIFLQTFNSDDQMTVFYMHEAEVTVSRFLALLKYRANYEGKLLYKLECYT